MGTDRYNYREKMGTGFQERSLIIIVQTSTSTNILVQLNTSGFICIHLAATMCNQRHLGSDRLIYMNLCSIKCILGQIDTYACILIQPWATRLNCNHLNSFVYIQLQLCAIKGIQGQIDSSTCIYVLSSASWVRQTLLHAS